MGLKINLEFDGAAQAAPASFRAAIQHAASILDAAFSNPVTINIQIQYGENGIPSGYGLGGPTSGVYADYSTVRADLIADASGGSYFAALPTGSAIQGQSSIAVWPAQEKLLGMLPANGREIDGIADFSPAVPQSNLVGLALHELTHALGRVPYGPQPDIFDLFRFTSPGTRLFTDGIPSVPAYFSVDGGHTKLADYDETSDPGDFLNPPKSNLSPEDWFDEHGPHGTRLSLTTLDLTQMDVLGFNPTTSIYSIVKALTHNSIQTTTDALNFDANDETWIINPGIMVSSQSANGVSGTGFANNTLINHGRISSSGSLNQSGVLFDDGNAAVLNAVGARIFGEYSALYLDGVGNKLVNNFGNIVAAMWSGIYFGQSASRAVVNNYGHIFGGEDAIYFDSDNTSGVVNNYATILSDGPGIDIDTEPTLLTHIVNGVTGVIKGLSDAIVGSDGRFRLVNHGTVIGNIDDADNANDVIINSGRIKGTVDLGSGNDVFNGSGGSSGAIFASGGNDRIIAGNGNVNIHVGGGFDIITAGPGPDRFVFDSSLAGQVEKITNFKPGLNKIVLSETDFAGIGPIGHRLAAADFHIGGQARTTSQHVIYDAHTGFLYYDSDGDGPAPPSHFATVSPHLALTHSAFLVVA